MLWQRVVTSVALLALILGAVFGLSATLFSFFILLIMGLGAWEWSSLAGFSSSLAKGSYVAVLLTVMLLCTLQAVPINLLLYLSSGCWLGAFILIYAYPDAQLFWGNKPALSLIGFPLFIPGWLAFYTLRSQEFHEFHILLLFFLVASADIGAYFAGRAFGKHKLAVRVSPNKTWEGFAGGVLACMLLIVSVVFVFSEKLPELTLILWFKLLFSALLISTFSVIGDLFESMVKRFRDVKDSGAILPGHGGILDRVDGLTAAAPLYAILLIQLGPEIL